MINISHPKYKELLETDKHIINSLHIVRDILMQQAYVDRRIAKSLYETWFNLELALQELWGFEYDPNYIKTWNYPHCTCPKMDNEDAYPTGHYLYSVGCPIHGEKK